MNYYIWYLTAALLNPAPEPLVQNISPTAAKPAPSNWEILHNDSSPLTFQTHLYNRSHNSIDAYFTLDKDPTPGLDGCTLSFNRRPTLRIINGKCYLWSVDIEHIHSADYFDPLEGYVVINGRKMELKAGPRPKAEINVVWPECEKAGVDFDMLFVYDEMAEYDDYNYTSGDFMMPGGTKLKIEFDYGYSYDAAGSATFTLRSDTYKEHNQFASLICLEERIKRPQDKLWNHYEATITTPANSNAISFRFTPSRPAKPYTLYIRDFKIAPTDEKP